VSDALGMRVRSAPVDYYMTLATVLPLLYVAIVLEGRFAWMPRASDLPDAEQDPVATRMWDLSLAWDQAMTRLLVYVGLPLTEVGLLVGIERGRRIDTVDDAVQVVGIAALLVLIVPPIWAQILPFVPERARWGATTYGYSILVLAFIGLVVFNLAGWFGTG
jgi:hypothetical protein